MSKFHYCSSYDELVWHVNANSDCVHHKSCDQLNDIGRIRLKEWIEASCQGDVYVWNESRTPYQGEANWQARAFPHGHAKFYFTKEQDATLLAMKWGL